MDGSFASFPWNENGYGKLGTEWLSVPAQAYGAWWEVMERGGSYAAPLLWIGLHQFVSQTRASITICSPVYWHISCCDIWRAAWKKALA